MSPYRQGDPFSPDPPYRSWKAIKEQAGRVKEAAKAAKEPRGSFLDVVTEAARLPGTIPEHWLALLGGVAVVAVALWSAFSTPSWELAQARQPNYREPVCIQRGASGKAVWHE